MITDFLLQLVIVIVAVVTAPVVLIIRPLFGKVDFTQVGEYGKTFLSWASIFIQPEILKMMVTFVPTIFAAKAMISIYRWIVRLVRG